MGIIFGETPGYGILNLIEEPTYVELTLGNDWSPDFEIASGSKSYNLTIRKGAFYAIELRNPCAEDGNWWDCTLYFGAQERAMAIPVEYLGTINRIVEGMQ